MSGADDESVDPAVRAGAAGDAAEPSGAAKEEPAVAVERLTRRFGPLTAVEDLTFDVEDGELFGIVGPDGAGKTTILRILAGILRPSSGDARIRGTSVSDDPEGVKPHVAYMPQRFGLYEDLTVSENLAFYADLYRVPRADRPDRLERLYRFSGLGDFRDRLAGALSGGMKQKLALSCALVHHPGILLLDEPTFGVDPISRRDLWLILHEMVAGGVTVVVSTSYMDEAERCDRVVLMDGGRALALDRPAVLQRSLPGTLIRVLADRPRDARDVLRRQGVVVSAALFGEGVHALLRPGADFRPVHAALEAAGIEVRDLREEEAGLEDVFIGKLGGRVGGGGGGGRRGA